jgi:polysaccharide pyruvyl transferase WcaK-like protein
MKKRKIILCGATHGSNFGDSLFAVMFKEKIEAEYPNYDVVFTKVSQYSKTVLKLKKAKLRDYFSSRYFIYISGGYFGESPNETNKKTIKRFLYYHFPGLLALILGSQIAIIGVGVGPIKKVLIPSSKKLFKKAKLIVVRDQESLVYLRKLGITNSVYVSTDSALAFEFDSEKNMNCSNSHSSFLSKNKKNVLIHLPNGGFNLLFDNNILKTIEESILINSEHNLIMCSDSLESNPEKLFINELCTIYNAKHYEYNDPYDFLLLLNSVDFVISAKLHVSILSSRFGKSVISTPINPGKTKRFFSQIGFSDRVYDINNFSKSCVKQILIQLNNNIHIDDTIIDLANSNFSYLIKFLSNK